MAVLFMYRKSADFYNHSLKFLDGDNVQKSERDAFLLNQQAAQDGMHDAVLAMGWFYLNGIGTEPDLEQARYWYKKSARQGDVRAMFSLGYIAYFERDGVDAHSWFKRALDKDHVRSMYWIGKTYWRGYGVEQDRQLACVYFKKAADKKVKEAQRTLRIFAALQRAKRAE
jgi:TPR repeat protein